MPPALRNSSITISGCAVGGGNVGSYSVRSSVGAVVRTTVGWITSRSITGYTGWLHHRRRTELLRLRLEPVGCIAAKAGRTDGKNPQLLLERLIMLRCDST